jgi:thiol:disulfide interchange protein DsbD
MLQNAHTLTSAGLPRNLFAMFVLMVCTACLLSGTVKSQTAFAQTDPFLVPLKSLNKIDPANVVQFKVVALTTKGNAATAEVEVSTRGGFKIYDKGLRFEYKSTATLNALIPLTFQANPPAKVIQDPFYNEPRAVHESAARFALASDLPMEETGTLRVRFEACSVNTCLLPAYFVIQARVGSSSRPEPKGDTVTGASGSTGSLSPPSMESSTLASGSSAASAAPAMPTPAIEQSPAPSAPTPAVELTPSQAAPASTPAPSFRPEKSADTSLADSITAQVQRSLVERSWLLFPALFLAGLLMNLTPCVYPMIPITLNVLSRTAPADSTGQRSPSQSAVPAMMYVLGIILAYSAMGVVAGMTGSIFGSLLQSKLVNGVLALTMFLLGLSMLDVFDLSKIQTAANRIPLSKKSPYMSVITMGAVSGLVAAPCTGPVLSMLLLLVGQTKDPVYGFVLMSVFAAGFGAPYLALGLLSQQLKRLPKAGFAMNIVKNVFAALMFSLALYYLKPMLQNLEFVALLYIRPPVVGVAAVVMLTVVFLVLQSKKPTSALRTIGLQTGLSLLALWMALYLIKGFIAGEKTALPSLSRINDPLEIPNPQSQETDGVRWMKDWQQAVRAAKEQNKGLIVDAWAQWCAACLKMDAEVWNEPGVEALINQHFIALKIDFTESNPQSEELTKRWDLSGLPAVGIYPAGSDFAGQPVVLFREAATVSSFHQAVQKIFNGELQKK